MTTVMTSAPDRRRLAESRERINDVAQWEWILLGVLLLALAVSLARLVGVGDILGHDEAVYASRARSWLHHTSTSSWSAHRAPGLPVLAVPLLALGADASELRWVGVVFAVLLATGVWALARRIGGPVAAPVAVAGILFSRPLLEHGSRLLTDLPATALIVWLMWIITRETEREGGVGPGLLWAAPLAAAAVYMRFGAALPLALVAAVALLVWPLRILAGARWIAATAALAVLLLGWHLAGAVQAFGTPWGRLLYTARLTRTDGLGAALTEYVRTFPGPLAGVAAAVVMSLGLVGLPVLLITRRRWDQRARAAMFILAVGVGHFVVMGITSAPDVRFIFVALVLFSVLGGVVLDGLLADAGGTIRVGVTVVAVLVLAGVGAGRTTAALADDRRSIDERYDAMRAAAAVITTEARPGGAAAGGHQTAGQSTAECTVLTSYVPQIEWLTGCAAFAFDAEHGDVERAFVLLLRDGKRQPHGAELESLLRDATEVGVWDLHEARIGEARLYRLP